LLVPLLAAAAGNAATTEGADILRHAFPSGLFDRLAVALRTVAANTAWTRTSAPLGVYTPAAAQQEAQDELFRYDGGLGMEMAAAVLDIPPATRERLSKLLCESAPASPQQNRHACPICGANALRNPQAGQRHLREHTREELDRVTLPAGYFRCAAAWCGTPVFTIGL
jgi:hypothetical protein